MRAGVAAFVIPGTGGWGGDPKSLFFCQPGPCLLLPSSDIPSKSLGRARLCSSLGFVQCKVPKAQFCCRPGLASARGCRQRSLGSWAVGSSNFQTCSPSPHPRPAFPYCCVFPIGGIHPQVQNTHTWEGCGGRIGPLSACEGCFPWPVREHILLGEKECWAKFLPYCKQAAVKWPSIGNEHGLLWLVDGLLSRWHCLQCVGCFCCSLKWWWVFSPNNANRK